MNIQEVTLDQVSQIYLGKDKCCRCGCGGKYISTSFMDNPRNEVDDDAAAKLLARAKRLALSIKSEVDYGGTYINVSFGSNRAICIYTDEIKK